MRPADLGEGVGGLADLIGLFEPPFGGQAQPVRDVVVQRAMALAIGHAALAAPAGLLGGLVCGVFTVDLVKILRPQCGGALFRHLFVCRDELEHPLRCHSCASLVL
jgi:hypothetical protein